MKDRKTMFYRIFGYSAKDIAKYCGVSTTHIHRMFRTRYNIIASQPDATPNTYYNACKEFIDAVQKLMEKNTSCRSNTSTIWNKMISSAYKYTIYNENPIKFKPRRKEPVKTYSEPITAHETHIEPIEPLFKVESKKDEEILQTKTKLDQFVAKLCDDIINYDVVYDHCQDFITAFDAMKKALYDLRESVKIKDSKSDEDE